MPVRAWSGRGNPRSFLNVTLSPGGEMSDAFARNEPPSFERVAQPVLTISAVIRSFGKLAMAASAPRI